MKAWGAIVCLAVLAGAQVIAEELAFPEDVQRQSSSRIVSGWEASEGQIPWQLSLRMVNGSGSVSSCGGSIIHPEWGMTAAHCTATRYTMVLRAGAVNLWRPELLFETTEYYNHPLYIDQLVSEVQTNDIALLKFPRAITFSDRVQPIRIQRDADKNRNYAGIRLEASGWGRIWTEGPAPENLQWVYLNGVSNLACWFAYGGSSTIVDSTICAGYYNVSSQSTCQGDSGGPLVALEEDGKYTMVGVSSFVARAGCHVAEFPAGFIRPGHYHDWYRQVTGINFDWEHQEPTEPPSVEDSSSSSESNNEESEETIESSSEEAASESETEETSEEAAPEPETEEVSEEAAPETETEEESEEAASEPETEEVSEEATPEPVTEEESEEVAPEPETEEVSEEAAPEPETEEVSEEAVPEPETEEVSEEAVPEPETEEVSEEAAPEPETEEVSEEAAPEPETEEESGEAAPEPETEISDEAAPEPETEEVSVEASPEPETEEIDEGRTSLGKIETPEESRYGFPAFAKFFL